MPYSILQQVGLVIYEVGVFGRRKQKQILHVNMLRKWHALAESAYWAENIADELENEIPHRMGDLHTQREGQLWGISWMPCRRRAPIASGGLY